MPSGAPWTQEDDDEGAAAGSGEKGRRRRRRRGGRSGSGSGGGGEAGHSSDGDAGSSPQKAELPPRHPTIITWYDLGGRGVVKEALPGAEAAQATWRRPPMRDATLA
mmetsp:Transcript_12224/g.35091  ORF Transcript_12224/g.35091 Transcript_12224/m.35091 type:complete len:107 (-) Transcript_12224:58-378(-)|eukprot:CAMPEP_0176077468 /NCGR_PEP_ID=MMETSP0120_2-20121206/38734_1 /TAXON_ID=160619 /ORGANISM="Kryptoperidinium foliaceum, Strain CCMP 1326" /LENGTH=106 /DNA_ID=CAMNT_0017411201 /DNA_START=121 /DNA_END=441 /DNA_ORIENTATION=+